jgi:hypothetical protein
MVGRLKWVDCKFIFLQMWHSTFKKWHCCCHFSETLKILEEFKIVHIQLVESKMEKRRQWLQWWGRWQQCAVQIQVVVAAAAWVDCKFIFLQMWHSTVEYDRPIQSFSPVSSRFSVLLIWKTARKTYFRFPHTSFPNLPSKLIVTAPLVDLVRSSLVTKHREYQFNPTFSWMFA